MTDQKRPQIESSPVNESIPLSKADVHTLENLDALIKNVFRSKTILKQFSALEERGLIEFYPMSGKASLTSKGHTALNSVAESSS